MAENEHIFQLVIIFMDHSTFLEVFATRYRLIHSCCLIVLLWRKSYGFSKLNKCIQGPPYVSGHYNFSLIKSYLGQQQLQRDILETGL